MMISGFRYDDADGEDDDWNDVMDGSVDITFIDLRSINLPLIISFSHFSSGYPSFPLFYPLSLTFPFSLSLSIFAHHIRKREERKGKHMEGAKYCYP